MKPAKDCFQKSLVILESCSVNRLNRNSVSVIREATEVELHPDMNKEDDLSLSKSRKPLI